MNQSIELVAEQAARAAGALIQQSVHSISTLSIQQKSLHDYVSEVDRGAEKIIVETILSAFPEHQILGEEYGHQGGHSQQYCWIIDPLDGTTNFLRSIPHYAVSIAVLKDDELIHGVVYDVAKGEFFCATRGGGAFLNTKAIGVSHRNYIEGSLLATGVPYSGENLAQIDPFTQTMVGLLGLQTSGIRRLGAAALDLAYVAAGRYDGFWEANLMAWDIAAGVLLVQEAGGLVAALDGGETFMQNGNILAATPGVFSDMLKVTSVNYVP